MGVPSTAAAMAVPSTVADLRKALRSELDISITARTQIGGRQGEWMYLTAEQMKVLYQQRQAHMSGFLKTKDWAAKLPNPDMSDWRRAYAFWYNLDPNRADLPGPCVAGLTSATRWCNVKLLCYKHLSAPEEVELVSAEEFLPKSRMLELLEQEVPIAQLADLVRLKALLAGGVGGWIIDADTFWVRPPEEPEFPWHEPAWGHVFASLRAAPCGRTELEVFQHWTVNFLKEPMDKLYLGTPFFFPAQSLLLQDIVAALQPSLESRDGGEAVSGVSLTTGVSGVSLTAVVSGASLTTAASSSTRQYCFVMDLVRSLIQQHGLEGAIAPPGTFAPLDYFSWKREAVVERPMTKALAGLFANILAGSTGVNMYWSSSRDADAHERGSLAKVHPESLWAKITTKKQECRKLLCRSWRKTGKLPWPCVKELKVPLELGLPGIRDFSYFAKKYTLRRFLKQGTYGSVYVAEDRLEAQVAIKIVASSEGELSGREVYIHKYCAQHANVVEVLDGFVSPFYMALAMPLAQDTLYSFVKRHAPAWTLAVARSIVTQIAAGLEHVHGRKVMHRDMHTGNILVFGKLTDAAGSEGGISPSAVRLADFGLACMHPNASVAPNFADKLSVDVVGGYNAAPEIVFVAATVKRAHYTYALDVWAFACIALEIGSGGVPPFMNRRGRDGIKDRILHMFGSRLADVSRSHQWSGDHDRLASDEIPWGLWRGDKRAMVVIHQALLYNMYRRPTMQACRQAFDSPSA